MADWNTPTASTNYLTLLSNLKDRDVDVLTLGGAAAILNPPNNAVRLNRNSWKFETYSSTLSQWGDMQIRELVSLSSITLRSNDIKLAFGTTSGNNSLTIGEGRTGSGDCTLSMIGDTTYSGGGLQITRFSGANGISYLNHRGTGEFRLQTSEAALISFYLNSALRWWIASDGSFIQDQTNGGDLVLGRTDATIRMNTSDGSDNKNLVLAGGGASAAGRGGRISLRGNEYSSSPGWAFLRSGDASGARVAIQSYSSNGGVTIGTGSSATDRWDFTANGHFLPVADLSYTIGSVSWRPLETWTGLSYVRNDAPTTTGTTRTLTEIQTPAPGNVTYLRTYSHRHTDGNSWEGVGVRIQHVVDASSMAFLGFNSTNASQDLVIGHSNNVQWRKTQGGAFMPQLSHSYDLGGTSNVVNNTYSRFVRETNAIYSPSLSGLEIVTTGPVGLSWGTNSTLRASMNSTGATWFAHSSNTGNSFEVRHRGGSGYTGNVLRLDSDSPTGGFAFLYNVRDVLGTPDVEQRLMGDGTVFADGAYNTPGADYAEYFESLDGESIEPGLPIVLISGKVRAAAPDEDESMIIGVSRPKAAHAIIGNHPLNWHGKVLRDDYGIPLLDESGSEILNPDYDPSQEYIERKDRDEWVLVGLLGQIPVQVGARVKSSWIKLRDISDQTAMWLVR